MAAAAMAATAEHKKKGKLNVDLETRFLQWLPQGKLSNEVVVCRGIEPDYCWLHAGFGQTRHDVHEFSGVAQLPIALQTAANQLSNGGVLRMISVGLFNTLVESKLAIPTTNAKSRTKH